MTDFLQFIEIDGARSIPVILEEGVSQGTKVDVVILLKLCFDFPQESLQVTRADIKRTRKQTNIYVD